MATNTPNYGLKKPNVNEIYHVEDTNSNMDKIDTQMKVNASKIGQVENNLGTSNNEINILKNKDTDLQNKINEVDKNRSHYATAVGTNNYSCTVNGINLYTGMRIFLKTNTANTGNSTLNLNNTSAKTIKFNNSNLVGGELKASQTVILVYNGVNWELQSTAGTTEIQSKEESKKQIDDMKIGGENLLSYGNDLLKWTIESQIKVIKEDYYFKISRKNISQDNEGIFKDVNVIPSTEYIISFPVKNINGNPRFSIGSLTGDEWHGYINIIKIKPNSTNSYKIITKPNEKAIRIYFTLSPKAIDDFIEIYKINVQTGNKLTAWSSAPEDLVEESKQYTDTKISEENTKIETNKNNIAGNLNKINSNTGRISTFENQSNTNKNNISSNLGKINSNTGRISSNTSKINTNTQAISTANGKINTNKNNINSNLGQINALKNLKLDKNSRAADTSKFMGLSLIDFVLSANSNLDITDNKYEEKEVRLKLKNKTLIVKFGTISFSGFSDNPSGKRAYYASPFPGGCLGVLCNGKFIDKSIPWANNQEHKALPNILVFDETKDSFGINTTDPSALNPIWYAASYVSIGY